MLLRKAEDVSQGGAGLERKMESPTFYVNPLSLWRAVNTECANKTEKAPLVFELKQYLLLVQRLSGVRIPHAELWAGR